MKKILLFLVLTSLNLVAQTPIWHYTFDGIHTPVDGQGATGPALLRLSGGIPTTANYGMDRFGNAGNSLICNDASADMVYETDLPNLPQGTAVRSFSFWVRYKSFQEQHVFKYGSNSLYNIFGVTKAYGSEATNTFTTTGDMQIVSYDNPNYPTRFSYDADDNDAWYHYVVIVDASAMCHIYRNGVLLASNGIAANLNTIGTVLRFGAYDMTSMNTVSTNFLLDDFKVYDVALTQTQIRDMYANETPYNGTDLVAYYGFENNLDCTNNSTYNLTAQNSTVNVYQAGIIGQSRKIEFNPIYNDVIGANINNSSFTIMAWERLNQVNTATDYATTFEYGASAYIRRRQANLYLGYASSSSQFNEKFTHFGPLYTWTHHTLTVKMIGGTFHLVYYRNGELLSITDAPANAATSVYTFVNKLVLGGGSDASGNIMSNKRMKDINIDEVYVYNRVLSQPEILATMYRTTAPTFTSCPTGSVTLTTQAEVDALASCTTISGELIINGNGSVLDLSPLNNITTITGNLVVENLGNTGNLSMLNSITNIGGAVALRNLSASSISGFNNINTLLGLSTSFCNNLVSFDAFTNLNQLTSGNWNLEFFFCPLLNSVSGLSSLTQVANINIVTCPSLTSLSFLDSLTTYTGLNVRISLYGNFNLTDISALNGVTGQPITELVIVDNSNLATCAESWVCDYLATTTPNATISGNATGCESVVAVNTACAVLSSENFDLNSFNLYPNPTNSMFNVEITNDSVKTISVVDITGKVVTTSNVTTVDVSNLMSGIYMVKVETISGKTGMKKLVKY